MCWNCWLPVRNNRVRTAIIRYVVGAPNEPAPLLQSVSGRTKSETRAQGLPAAPGFEPGTAGYLIIAYIPDNPYRVRGWMNTPECVPYLTTT